MIIFFNTEDTKFLHRVTRRIQLKTTNLRFLLLFSFRNEKSITFKPNKRHKYG